MAPLYGGPCGDTREGVPVPVAGLPTLHGPPPSLGRGGDGSKSINRSLTMADISTGSSASVVSARPELSIHDGTVTTTSLQVAQFFGKRHRDVMRAIRSLTAEMPEDHARNFARMVAATGASTLMLVMKT